MLPDARPLRSIAFYLPQYHPIQENDEWWGTGFTDWRNVVRARPRFKGHYQPHIPGDLGFYDLRLPETRRAQAELAREYGVSGFCYYHYWFNGRHLLDRPFSEVLRSGEPDLPFALCWANEDWTRRWDGRSSDVLMRQSYGATDHRAHARWLVPAFEDERYLRVEGKPLFAVYRASHIPDIRAVTDIWREEAASAGVGQLFLCRVESFLDERDDPQSLGFDAAIQFQPDWGLLPDLEPRRILRWASRLRGRVGRSPDRVYRYDALIDRALAQPEPDYIRFPCVVPMWDNSARRQHDAVIFDSSTPEAFARWVRSAGKQALSLPVEDPLLFVNAWNEWAEGSHLEPDLRWGTEYLRAHRDALAALRGAPWS